MKNKSIDHLFRFCKTLNNMTRTDGMSKFEFVNDAGIFMLQNYQVALCWELGVEPTMRLYSFKNKRIRRNRLDPDIYIAYLESLENSLIKQGKEIPYTNETQRKELNSKNYK